MEQKEKKKKKKRSDVSDVSGWESLIHGIIIIRPIRFSESYSRVASALARAKTWRVETEEERGTENRVVKRTTRAASFSERVSSAGLVQRLV